MAQESLKSKTAKSMVWTILQRFANMGIQFISGIILARLLSPEDYGIIGMLTIFMLVSQAFIDGGFGAALIQKKNPTQEDYSTIFWWNIAMGVVLYIVLFVSAPAIARFYHMDVLCPVLRVQAIILIVSALSSIQSNQMTKQFRFKELSIISLVSSLVAIIVTIFLAYHGFGVWALVAQGVILAVLPMVAYWRISNWKPSLCFSVFSLKKLASFGIYMFLTHLINEFCNNIQGLLIGRVYNAETMGYYSKARSTEKLATNTITQAIKQVTFPFYSELQSNKDGLINAIKKLTNYVGFFTFPLMLLLIIVAKPLFIILYTDKWVDCVPYFQILCFAGIPGCLQSINLQSIAAIGKSNVMFIWTIIKRVVGIVLMVGGLYIWGIYGLLVGMVLQIWILYFINASLVSKYIGYMFFRQLKDLAPTLMIAIIAFVIPYYAGDFISTNMYITALIQTIVYVIIYLLGAKILHLEALCFMTNMIKKVIKK